MGAHPSDLSNEFESFFCDQTYSLDTAFMSVCREDQHRRASFSNNPGNFGPGQQNSAKTKTQISENLEAEVSKPINNTLNGKQKQLKNGTSIPPREFREPPIQRIIPPIIGHRPTRRTLEKVITVDFLPALVDTI